MNQSAPPIDLRPDHWAIVCDVLRQHIPDREVLAFGSRATWTAKDYSDLDLAVLGNDALPLEAFSNLTEGFGESDLPFKVDIVDWAGIEEAFRTIIRRDGVVLQEPSKNSVAIGPEPRLATEAWRTMPFTEAVVVNPKVRLERGTKYPFVDMAAVEAGLRCVHAEKERVYSGGGSRFQDGDTLMARITPCLENGKIGRYVAGKLSPSAHGSTEFIVIRGREGVTDSAFAYYLTQWEGVRGYAVNQMIGTSGRQRVPVKSLNHLSVRVPPLREQRAIAHVLGTLDDKIELNRRTSDTLEAIARAIFKDWFVDFGPTRAKAGGRAPYLDPGLWDLFPDALDGEGSPVNWQRYTLDDLVDHHRATLSPNARSEHVFEHYSIPAYDAGREPTPDRGASIKSNKTIVPEGAVLLSGLNPEHERVWLPYTKGEAIQIASTEFLAFTPVSPATRSVLYCLFANPNFRVKMTARVTGTSKSHQRVSPESLLACEVLVADPRLLAWFDRVVGPMVMQLLSSRRESAELAKARELLLRNLVSGQVRLREEEFRKEKTNT